ncbi:AraC family transcriptional regulator [Acerihabitans sp.]|uniref:AraC family transcriptional regulator n=1 Tax=Acerihabitans sp. TaxID=2811394 RepID=UPI002EDA55B6
MADNSEISIDPFSDILRFTNAETVVSGGFSAAGAWAIRFPAPDKIKFFALVKGNCWLRLDGREAPVRVGTGDVLLLTAQRGFVLAGSLTAPPVDAAGLFSGNGLKTAILGSGDDCVQIGGHVRLDPLNGGLLAEVLPPLIHVRAASPQAGILTWLLDQLVRERAAGLPGSGVASAQLAQLMFVQILRAHINSQGPLTAGWLRAVGDKRLAPALRLMHGNPGRTWRLEDLAGAAAMSRTTFALHFKNMAGVPPLVYLTRWRMRLAQRALREDNTPVAVLAGMLGYTSESAFSNAFKRATGKAPRHYRSEARANATAVAPPSP